MSELDAYREAVARRREAIMERVDAALAQSGRKAGSVKVMAVSKTVDVPQVVAAIDAGYRFFGENRPQELVRKLEGLSVLAGEDGCVAGADARELRFDMIGNLQTNKIKKVLGRATPCSVAPRASIPSARFTSPRRFPPVPHAASRRGSWPARSRFSSR